MQTQIYTNKGKLISSRLRLARAHRDIVSDRSRRCRIGHWVCSGELEALKPSWSSSGCHQGSWAPVVRKQLLSSRSWWSCIHCGEIFWFACWIDIFSFGIFLFGIFLFGFFSCGIYFFVIFPFGILIHNRNCVHSTSWERAQRMTREKKNSERLFHFEKSI